MALGDELHFDRLHLDEMLGLGDINEGKSAVVKGNDFQGEFGSHEEALEGGYAAYGLVPFLVEKIELVETIAYFSRPV